MDSSKVDRIYIMGVYQFTREQIISESPEELWKFISDPKNLKKITPDKMGFDITSSIADEMYQGMIISYKVAPLFGIKTTWVTEITHIEPGRYFVDEQRVGPYKLWHHQHFLEETKEGTLMTDIVTYKPPMGWIGSIANSLLIKKKLNEIFDYRRKAMISEFGG